MTRILMNPLEGLNTANYDAGDFSTTSLGYPDPDQYSDTLDNNIDYDYTKMFSSEYYTDILQNNDWVFRGFSPDLDLGLNIETGLNI